MSKLRSGLTYANVIATIALFLALGGGAYAALKIPNGSVGTKQLKAAAVTRAKLHSGAVNGSKVVDHSLTGRQINAGTLGLVPNAGHATGADTAGHATGADTAAHATSADSATTATDATRAGNGAQRIDFQSSASDPAPAGSFSPAAHTLLTLDELTVKASCIDAGGGQARTYVTFSSTVGARIDAHALRFNNPGVTTDIAGFSADPVDPDHGTRTVADLTGGDLFETGTWIFRTAARTVTLTLNVGAQEWASDCSVQGTAVAAPN